MNELQPCISPNWPLTGAALNRATQLSTLISAKHARMQWATAKVSRFRLNASIVVSGGNKCAKGTGGPSGRALENGRRTERKGKSGSPPGWCSQQRPGENTVADIAYHAACVGVLKARRRPDITLNEPGTCQPL
jgi:hypothetical protein